MVLITTQAGLVNTASDLHTFFEQSFGNHSFYVSTVVSDGFDAIEVGIEPSTVFILNDSTRQAVWLLVVQVCNTDRINGYALCIE